MVAILTLKMKLRMDAIILTILFVHIILSMCSLLSQCMVA